MKKSYFELVSDAVVNIGNKQIISKGDLDQIDFETEFNSCFGKWKIKN